MIIFIQAPYTRELSLSTTPHGNREPFIFLAEKKR